MADSQTKKVLRNGGAPQTSPSPEAPSEEMLSRLSSYARSSRATSEERPDTRGFSPEASADISDQADSREGSMTAAQMASYRSSRAGSEAPQRFYDANEELTLRNSRAGSEVPMRSAAELETLSERSSRAGSEAPQRSGYGVAPRSTASSRAGSEAPDRNAHAPGAASGVASPKRTVKVVKGPTTPTPVPLGGGGMSDAATLAAAIKAGTKLSPQESLRATQKSLYHTVRHGTGAFHYYQCLHYPLEDKAEKPSANTDGIASSSTATSIRTGTDPSGDRSEPSPSPVPRHSGSLEGGALTAEGPLSGGSPSPVFDEAAFNHQFATGNDGFLDGNPTDGSFSFAVGEEEEEEQRAVSVLAMTTIPDPVSGVPVVGICMGDCSGYVEYFEVTASDSGSRRLRKSRSLVNSKVLPSSQSRRRHDDDESPARESSLNSPAAEHIAHDMRGREVARRHGHKAYIKTINALTSVAVEPSMKCLAFVRQQSSPSVVSYLTANERVIKLFHVRREGFNPFSAFPLMESVIAKEFVGSRYFARLPPQTTILPIKEYGPCSNSIQALSVSADEETFMSVEDLQVFWWHFEASDTTKATCIADLRPPSRALEEVDELVTAASFHPTHGSLFLMSRSSGVLNIGDLRDPPSRDSRQYAITTEVRPDQNPCNIPSYNEILCSISAASFLGPDHVVTRDYLSLKLWDLRKPERPCAMVPIISYVSSYLDPLYENDCIFDRFPVAVDHISGSVITGLYDGAVAVWQPLNPTLPPSEALAHYRVVPDVDPSGTPKDGRISVHELEQSLADAWAATSRANAMGNRMEEEIPEPFTNRVLNVAVAPGGERFAYTYKDGRLVYFFERKATN